MISSWIIQERFQGNKEDTGKWTCYRCGKTFTSSSEVGSHIIQCQEIKCEFCQKTFKLKQHLKHHKEKKHSNYRCKVCNRGFENIVLLRDHERSKSCNEASNQSKIVCNM